MMHSTSPRPSLNLLQGHPNPPQSFTSRKVILTQYFEQSSSKQLNHIRSNHTLLQFAPQLPNARSNKHIEEQKLYYNLSRRRTDVNTQLQFQKQTQHMRGLLSPNQIPSINRRINFTYKKPTNNKNQNSLNTYTSTPSLLNLESRIKTQSQRKKDKREKNKLCTCQFSFSYTPCQNYNMRYSLNNPRTKRISFIQQLELSAKLLSQRDSSIKTITSSKMASTTATQSIYIQNSANDLLTQGMNSRQNNSQMSFFKTASNNNLFEKIPSSKQLGKTVIIPSYSFGGVIEHDNEFKTFLNEQMERKNDHLKSNKCLPRQWNHHVKGLIDNQCSQQLKHSIHCGPQIRLQHHKFDLLNGFGRQIKESTIQFCE